MKCTSEAVIRFIEDFISQMLLFWILLQSFLLHIIMLATDGFMLCGAAIYLLNTAVNALFITPIHSTLLLSKPSPLIIFYKVVCSLTFNLSCKSDDNFMLNVLLFALVGVYLF